MDGVTSRQTAWLLPDTTSTCGCSVDLLVKLCHLLLHSPISCLLQAACLITPPSQPQCPSSFPGCTSLGKCDTPSWNSSQRPTLTPSAHQISGGIMRAFSGNLLLPVFPRETISSRMRPLHTHVINWIV